MSEPVITITTDFAKLPVWINGPLLKQIKYAASVALYDTAIEARDKVRSDLPNNFTIRTPWVSKGIRIEPGASRAIRGQGQGLAGMQVAVGSVDPFMEKQELGGEKEPIKGNSVAVPRRDPVTETTTRRKWPGALLTRKRYFVLRKDNGKTFVVQRLGKERLPVKLRYVLVPKVRIPARWNFRDTVAGVATAERFMNHFDREFDRALATAK